MYGINILEAYQYLIGKCYAIIFPDREILWATFPDVELLLTQNFLISKYFASTIPDSRNVMDITIPDQEMLLGITFPDDCSVCMSSSVSQIVFIWSGLVSELGWVR